MEAQNAPDPGPQQSKEDAMIERTTLCVPNYAIRSVVQAGEDGFSDALHGHLPSVENNALERLVKLKSELRQASTLDFWGILLQEICEITGSQCGFVTKRILVNDDESAVEMPQPGKCSPFLVGIATYINNGHPTTEREYQYHTEGTPCPCMRHNKVCVVPERFVELYPDVCNIIPGKPTESFIGVPLFHDGKCFANFGVVWDSDGARQRKLGWGFIELLMHALEDVILQRILEGRGFAKDATLLDSTSAKVIPVSAVTPSQSLKPYAQSLSHELRTPMQGVVGMLDIMYATVLDAIANQQSDLVRAVFTDLKSHIEVVQGKSSNKPTFIIVLIDNTQQTALKGLWKQQTTSFMLVILICRCLRPL
jgi:hypothetical protein